MEQKKSKCWPHTDLLFLLLFLFFKYIFLSCSNYYLIDCFISLVVYITSKISEDIVEFSRTGNNYSTILEINYRYFLSIYLSWGQVGSSLVSPPCQWNSVCLISGHKEQSSTVPGTFPKSWTANKPHQTLCLSLACTQAVPSRTSLLFPSASWAPVVLWPSGETRLTCWQPSGLPHCVSNTGYVFPRWSPTWFFPTNRTVWCAWDWNSYSADVHVETLPGPSGVETMWLTK